MTQGITSLDLLTAPQMGSEARKMWGMGAGFGLGLAGGCSGTQWIHNRLLFLVLARLDGWFRRLLRYAASILTGGGGGRHHWR
jgi:hypothetical protein